MMEKIKNKIASLLNQRIQELEESLKLVERENNKLKLENTELKIDNLSLKLKLEMANKEISKLRIKGCCY